MCSFVTSYLRNAAASVVEGGKSTETVCPNGITQTMVVNPTPVQSRLQGEVRVLSTDGTAPGRGRPTLVYVYVSVETLVRARTDTWYIQTE